MLDILDKIMLKTGWSAYETALSAGMGVCVLFILYGTVLFIIEIRRRSTLDKYAPLEVYMAEQNVSIFQRYDFLFACSTVIAGTLVAFSGVAIGAWYIATTRPEIFEAIQGFKLW